MRLNFRDLPVWINEGLAEIVAHSLFTKREVTMGRPASYHLAFLQESKLLPLDVLFAVDHNSPHYNEQNKTSVFYAQSWAVTHYIYLSKEGRERNLLVMHLTETLRGVPPAEAAERAFGDLKKFDRTLRDYIRQQAFFGIKTKGGVDLDEKAFPARAFNAAEARALQGDFHVHMNRPADARAAAALPGRAWPALPPLHRRSAALPRARNCRHPHRPERGLALRPASHLPPVARLPFRKHNNERRKKHCDLPPEN